MFSFVVLRLSSSEIHKNFNAPRYISNDLNILTVYFFTHDKNATFHWSTQNQPNQPFCDFSREKNGPKDLFHHEKNKAVSNKIQIINYIKFIRCAIA